MRALMHRLSATGSWRVLESRMVFDGAAAEVVDQVVEPAGVQAPVADHAPNPASDAADIVAALTEAATQPASAPVTVVFIDETVENADQIIAAAGPSAEIVMIDASASGLAQVASYLAGRTDIGSIHIVSHGDTGTIYLGSDTLTGGSVGEHAAELAAIGAALADTGDILIYGCKVADGSGMALIDAIAEATGADVAASIDDTGGTEAGGDWVLEATRGAIEATALDNPLYAGLLVKNNTGAWSVTGLVGTNTTNGILTTVTFNASFSAVAGGSTLNNIAAFDNAAQGGQSLSATWNSGAGTVTIAFTRGGVPVAMTNVVLHMDRIGGINGTSNSSLWTLATAGTTLTRLSGPTHFQVNTAAGTFNRTTGQSTTGSESSLTPANGTAAGSVRINGTYTSLTFNVTQAAGPTGADAIELAFAIDAPPIAVNDTFTTVHDTAATINVRANDSDPTSDAFNVTQVNGTAITAGGPGVTVTGGVVTLNAAGNLVYTPNANFAGSPSFTYTIADAYGGSSTATVSGTVTNVTPVLDLDSSGAGTGWTTTFTENGAAVSIGDVDVAITDGDDANMDSASILLTNQQTGDRLLVNGSATATGSIGTITWTRTDTTVTLTGLATRAQYAAAIQQVQFENTTENTPTTPRLINVTVNDGTINSNTAVATIIINLAPDPVNDAFSGNEDVAISGNVLTNDTDIGTTPAPANPLSIVTGPVNGTLTSFNTATGAFVYQPNADFNGTDTFTYRYTDANGDSKTAIVTLTVNAVNDVPVNTVPATIGPVAEDATLAITGLSVADIDSGTLTTTLTVASGALNLGTTGGATVSGTGTGTVTLTGTAAQINAAIATLSFSPPADFNGTVAFQIATSDGALTDSDSRTITVTAVADIANDTASTNEDTPVTFAPLANDSFESPARVITAINGTAITAGGAGVGVTGGTVTLNADGTLTFAPTANFNGTPSFTYTVTSGGVTETATVNLTVNAVNDAPTQVLPGAQSTAEDANLVISGTSVADVDGGGLTTTLSIPVGTGTLSVVTGGGVTISGNGTRLVTLTGTAAQINAAIAQITYVPTGDYNGAAPLSVSTSDGTATASGTVAITVTAVADITNDAVTTSEDTARTFNVITGTNGATADTFENAGRVVSSVTQPVNGVVTFAADGTITYTPNGNFNGADSFTYTVTSGGVTETATVSVTVTAVNDAPANTVPGAQTTTEDVGVTFGTATGNEITVADVDSNVTTTLTIANGTLLLGSTSGVTVTGNGTATVTVSGTPAAVTAALNGLSFTPVADWNGATALNVSTSDGVAPPAVSAVAITVTAVADIASDSAMTAEDTATSFNVLANDSFENAGRVVSSVTQPANGTVTFLANGQVTYTPASNYNGPDSFTYTVTSGGVTETTTVTLIVTPVNDPPVATPGVNQTGTDGAADSYNAGALFSDVDNASLTFTASGLPAGLAIDLSTGLISGTIDQHASVGAPGGVYSVTVTGTDASGAMASTTFTWTVANPAPVAGNDAFSGSEDTAIAGSVLGNDSDPDGDALSVDTTPVAGPANGTLVLNADGTFVYTPAPDFTGADTFTYRLVDADAGTTTATVTLFVNPVNDVPLNTVPGNQSTAEDAPLTFSTASGNAITVTDVDNGTITTTISVGNGTLSLGSLAGVTVSGNGTATVVVTGAPGAITAALNGLTYASTPDYHGGDVLTVFSDDGSATTTANIPITITPVADIAADSVATSEDAAISFNVLTGTNGASADSFEGSPAVTGFTQPANGTVTVAANGAVTYTPNANFNGVDTFSYTVTSGGVTETTTVTVAVAAVNDAPTQTLPGAQSGTEDVSVVFSGAGGNQIVVADIDAGATVTTTLSIAQGTLTAIVTPGVTITGNGSGSVTLAGSPAAVTAALNGLAYVPVADHNGAVTLLVSTTDGIAPPAAGSIVITLAPVADIANDTATTNEDTASVIAVLANDSFENGSSTVTAVTNGANGTVTINGDGTVTYTPNANFNGVDSFTYTVASGGVTETATVSITVSPVNDAPTQVVPGAQTLAEDGSLSFTGATAITVGDVDGGSLTTTLAVTNGTLTLGSTAGVTVSGNGTGTVVVSGPAAALNAAMNGLTFAPIADYNGGATLLVSTTDGTASASGSIALTVTPVVDIVADTITTSEDAAVTVNVLSNDNFENSGATITSVTQPANGVVTIGIGGQVTYTPNADYNGPDSFTYTVTSGGVTETTTVSVTVSPVNDPVVTTVPGGQVTNEDTGLIFASATGNAITVADVDGDPLTLTLSAANGLLTLGSTVGVTVVGNGSGLVTLSGPAAAITAALDGLVFAPTADYNGTAAISITSSDGTVTTSSAISITVNPVVDIVADGAATSEDTPVTFNVLTNDTFESAGRVVSSVTQGASGTVSFLADGTIVYTPSPGFSGNDTFTYTVTSGGVTETTTVNVSVGDVNDVPITTGLPDRTNLDGQAVAIAAGAAFFDPDIEPLTFSVVVRDNASNILPLASLGLTIDPATGLISGTLASGASQLGPYQVTVTADDGHPGGTVAATFTWTITNPAPTAVNDTATAAEDTPANINVLGNDIDPDGDTLTVVGIPTAGNGTVTVNPDGTIRYTPNADFNGVDTIAYQISDGNGGFSTATVSVTVTAVNDAPTTTGLGNLIDSDSQVIAINVTSAFSDIDGDTLTYSATGLPPGLSLDPLTGQISGMIDPGASGPLGDQSYPITVTADDGNGGTVSTSFTWRVLNIPPTSADDSVTTPEDTPVIATVLANDFDTDNDPLVITHINGQPITVGGPAVATANGSVTLTTDAFGNQVLVYTPDADYNGTDALVYTISDGNAGIDTATLTVTITPVNDAPTADPLADLANADSDTVSVGLAAFFHDVDAPEGDTLRFSAIGLPPGLGIDPVSGVVTGTIDPAASLGGPYTVVVTATDLAGTGLPVTATFEWTVTNPAPLASNDAATTAEGTNLTVTAASGLLANDSDPDGDAIVVAAINGSPALVGTTVAGSSGGLFTILADGSYTFDQAGAFENLPVGGSRTTTVTYQVSDGQGGFATATLAVTVTGLNDAPVAGALPAQSTLDGASFTLNAASGFSDPDGDALTYSIDPAFPLPPGLSIDPATGLISGTIDRSASQGGVGGVYAVRVLVDDGNGGTAAVTFPITVTNPAPIAGDDVVATSEDVVATGNVLANDSDPDGDALAVTGFTVAGLAGGFLPGDTATIPGVGTIRLDSTGAYTFTPATNYNGPVPLVTYTIVDADGAIDLATLALGPVLPVNDAPVSTPLPAQSGVDASTVALNVSGSFSDIDGDALTFSATGLPPGLSIDPATGLVTGTIDHLASAGGPYTVTITATDPSGSQTQQVFTWAVSNPPPIGAAIPDASGLDGTTIALPLGGGFSDPDGDTLSFSVSGLPAGFTIDPAGVIRGTWGAGASSGGPAGDGIYSVTVTATDSQGASVARSFGYTVTNPAPTALNDFITLAEDTSSGLRSVAGNDLDPDGDALTFALVTGPTQGALVFNPDGTFTYMPVANSNGNDTFTYTVTDADGAVATATVLLTITPVNDLPTPSASSFMTPEDTPVTGTLPSSDVEGTAVTFTLVTPPAHGGLVLGIDGTYTYTPNPDYTGPDAFIVRLTDGNGGTTLQTVSVTVTPVQDAPVARDDHAVTTINQPTTIGVLANDSDVDGDPLTVTGATADKGTVVINPDGTITFTPVPGLLGEGRITYTISDGNGGTSTATVTITIGEEPVIHLPPIILPPAPERPAERETLSVDGAVLDAVDKVGELGGISDSLSERGIIVSVVNQVSSLRGIAAAGYIDNASTRSVLTAERIWRIAETLEGLGYTHTAATWEPQGLTGFSLRMGLLGNQDHSGLRSQVIIESLVREKTLIVQISNLIKDSGRRVTEYRFLQADGAPLPGWLDRAGGGLLIGQRPANLDHVDLRVIVIYDDGTSETKDVRIEATTGEIKPLAGRRADLPAPFLEQFAIARLATDDGVRGLARMLGG